MTAEWKGLEVEPHFYGDSADADRFGKRGGYRVTPPGDKHNLSSENLYYRSLEDVAQHLIANPDRGVRMRLPNGQTSIFSSSIRVNGVPR